MEATRKNIKIVEKIIELLSEEKCTIDESTKILQYANNMIKETSMVQSAADQINQIIDFYD